MNEKQAKSLRKFLKTIVRLMEEERKAKGEDIVEIPYASYNEYQVPEFNFIEHTFFKIKRGIPRTLSDGCFRKLYQNIKKGRIINDKQFW